MDNSITVVDDGRGVLAAEPVSGRLTVDTLRWQYELQVFGVHPRRIPLRNEGANLLPNGVLLDGRPIESEWEPDAVALAFDVAEPGQYRLEVLLRPTIRGTVGTGGLRPFRCPALARSRLELTPAARGASAGRGAIGVRCRAHGKRPAAIVGRSRSGRPLDGAAGRRAPRRRRSAVWTRNSWYG